MIDGYAPTEIQRLMADRIRLNTELLTKVDEIKKLPKVPQNLGVWIESFSSQFKMSDFQKMFSISRQMSSLLEEQESNARKLKIAMINNTLDKINELVGKSLDQ